MSVAAGPSLPRLGEPAPALEAEITHGRVGLGDFSGDWLLSFSQLADLTPVCTTKFLAVAEITPQLKEHGVESRGLSSDSVYVDEQAGLSLIASAGRLLSEPG
ncbi:MAG: redoxin domain-containing protein [Acidobacteriota bacterium]|nr:redoxin domain-containing protein [Blastocatellia bacterium]MDW8239904.1 redoxin domain-containing protein [Acidobacteriota bacterium]